MLKNFWADSGRMLGFALVFCCVGALGIGVSLSIPSMISASGWFTQVDYSFHGRITVNLTASEPVYLQPLGRCSTIAIYLYSPEGEQQAPVTLVVRNGTGGAIAMLANRTSWYLLPPGAGVPRSAVFDGLSGQYSLEVRRENADTFFGCYVEAYSVTTYASLPERFGWIVIGTLVPFLVFVIIMVVGIRLVRQVQAQIQLLSSKNHN